MKDNNNEIGSYSITREDMYREYKKLMNTSKSEFALKAGYLGVQGVYRYLAGWEKHNEVTDKIVNAYRDVIGIEAFNSKFGTGEDTTSNLMKTLRSTIARESLADEDMETLEYWKGTIEKVEFILNAEINSRKATQLKKELEV